MELWADIHMWIGLAVGFFFGVGWAMTRTWKSPEDQEQRFLADFWAAYFKEWLEGFSIRGGPGPMLIHWIRTCKEGEANASSYKKQERWRDLQHRAEGLEYFLHTTRAERHFLDKMEFQPPEHKKLTAK